MTLTLPASQYFTGKPCKHGHIAPRWVANRVCVECASGDMGKRATKAYNARHPTRIKALKKATRQRNASYNLAYSRAYELANREKRKAYSRLRPKDRELRRVYESRRRVRLAGAGGAHTKEDVRQILDSQRWRCVYCKTDLRKVKKEVDHILPIAGGGTDDRTNLQVLCKSCNASKKARHPIEFAQTKGLLL